MLSHVIPVANEELGAGADRARSTCRCAGRRDGYGLLRLVRVALGERSTAPLAGGLGDAFASRRPAGYLAEPDER